MLDLLILFFTNKKKIFTNKKKKKSIFSLFPFIFNWGHIDPKYQISKKKKKYIPSEQPNQAQFFYVNIDRKCRKVPKSYSTEMKGTIFFN